MNYEIDEKTLKRLADECGLVYSGKNADGELEFIGTEQKWKKYEISKEDYLRFREEEPTENEKQIAESDDYDLGTCHTV